MHIVILNVFHVSCISVMCKSGEASSIEVGSKWSVAGDEAINTHVKFLATNQEWIDDVALHNVGFSLRAFWFPPEIVLPLCNLLQFVE